MPANVTVRPLNVPVQGRSERLAGKPTAYAEGSERLSTTGDFGLWPRDRHRRTITAGCSGNRGSSDTGQWVG